MAWQEKKTESPRSAGLSCEEQHEQVTFTMCHQVKEGQRNSWILLESSQKHQWENQWNSDQLLFNQVTFTEAKWWEF